MSGRSLRIEATFVFEEADVDIPHMRPLIWGVSFTSRFVWSSPMHKTFGVGIIEVQMLWLEPVFKMLVPPR